MIGNSKKVCRHSRDFVDLNGSPIMMVFSACEETLVQDRHAVDGFARSSCVEMTDRHVKDG